MSHHSPAFLEQLVEQAFTRAGARAEQAGPTARALVAAEAQQLSSHGLSRVAMYLGHMRHGRVDGQALPRIVAERSAAVLVDACDGFAYPACELAVSQAIERARQAGIAIGAVTNSHHFGVAAYHLMPAARAGMVGLAFGNSPAAMPVAGGKKALLGTNPIAAVFPMRDAPPVIVDMSLSEVARGKLMLAAQRGEPIPPGWALDEHGQPTTDAAQGLRGSMLAFGGTKGAMLALVVELLVTSLTGAQYGAEADSFFQPEGNRPRLGQVFIVLNPEALVGMEAYFSRIAALVGVATADPGVRMPGQRRLALEAETAAKGIPVDPKLLQELVRAAEGTA